MLGIFGGSFDPPHFGHIKSALALLEHFKFEQIRFIPCQLSPHKDSVNASAKHRWQMLNLVCNSHKKLIADDRELKRPAPSYTIDTLLELREEFGAQQSLVLILGMDAYLKFCTWHRYDEILSLCHLILMQRPGYNLPVSGCEKDIYDASKTEEIINLENTSYGNIYMSNFQKIDISSSVVRKEIIEKQHAKYLLPGNVWNYIRRNKLYQL